MQPEREKEEAIGLGKETKSFKAGDLMKVRINLLPSSSSSSVSTFSVGVIEEMVEVASISLMYSVVSCAKVVGSAVVVLGENCVVLRATSVVTGLAVLVTLRNAVSASNWVVGALELVSLREEASVVSFCLSQVRDSGEDGPLASDSVVGLVVEV